MKVLRLMSVVLAALVFEPPSASAQSHQTSPSPLGASRCEQGLEPGAGADAWKDANALHVDLDHGISMIFFPGHPGFPRYAVSLKPGKIWLLTYAVEKGGFPPYVRAFRASLPFQDDLAKRIESVWTFAIADAPAEKVKADARAEEAQKNGTLICMTLDGSGYLFSSNGKLATATDTLGNIPAQLLAISKTLRLILMDTKYAGHEVGFASGDLQVQLNRIEADLKIGSQH
ncbi:MAG: hypothetical protein JSS16_15540 [Proteobacteria bacterium]|nr:hypothetical protein [Pseudomonadota bacterium]